MFIDVIVTYNKMLMIDEHLTTQELFVIEQDVDLNDSSLDNLFQEVMESIEGPQEHVWKVSLRDENGNTEQWTNPDTLPLGIEDALQERNQLLH